MKTLHNLHCNSMSFFFFNEGTKELHLVHYRAHWNQPCEKPQCKFNEFSFSEHTRHLQLVYYKSHLHQPCKKNQPRNPFFMKLNETSWSIHNKVFKWARSKNSSLCPFLSNEKQGTSKINKIKITKISLISNSVSNPLVNFDFATHTCKVRRLRTPSP